MKNLITNIHCTCGKIAGIEWHDQAGETYQYVCPCGNRLVVSRPQISKPLTQGEKLTKALRELRKIACYAQPNIGNMIHKRADEIEALVKDLVKPDDNTSHSYTEEEKELIRSLS